MVPAPVGDLRLRANGYGFARNLVTVPLGIDEFEEARRGYPILFSEVDGFSFALLALGRKNSFVHVGRWESDAYLPGYVRRYPFVIGETDQADPVVMLDHDPEVVVTDGEDGEMLFENGNPTPLAESMLDECRVFMEGPYRRTCAFAEALKASGVLAKPGQDRGLPRSGTPFEIVDRKKVDGLGAAILREWASKGWLKAIDQHFSSLDRFADLVEREGQGEAGP